MLIPISWLKEFVDIKLPLNDLMWKMTEAGLTCESYKKVGDETVLDVEVTANRPDWMSVVGVAHEVAAIQNIRFKEPKEINLPKKSANFPLDLVPDFDLFERWTGIVIKAVEIQPSPKWLADRIRQMGHEPINNIIDITNYVMYELGIPMHAFDYDEISGQIMTVQKSKGGEEFTSVDNLSYKLPKDAIIIRDAERLIDLAGIKGGLNSGIKETTKNIFLHVTIDNPVLVRRTSQALGLRSEASAIYERVPDKGGTINSIKRAASLILELAGGEVASEMIDLKKQKFEPWKLALTSKKLDKILGITVEPKKVIDILTKLNLSPKKSADGIVCIIPTYRADIKIEEDLVEEVARIYGYNNFPQTLPRSAVNKVKIPYYFDDSFILNLKNIMISSGYSEAITLTLLSAETLDKFDIDKKEYLKLSNPVSLEYEYLRGSLVPSLSLGIKINPESEVKLFEIDKIYPSEEYKLSGISKGISFRGFKGVIDLIFDRLNIKGWEIEFETNINYLHPSKSGSIKIGKEIIGIFGQLSPKVADAFSFKDAIYVFEFDVRLLQKHSKIKVFEPVPENPAQIEDLTLTFPPKTRIGEVIDFALSMNRSIDSFELRDVYEDSYTFRVKYQDPRKTLTNGDVEKIRKEIISSVKTKFGGNLK